MINKLKAMDRAILELISGIVVFGVVFGLVALPFPIDRLKYAVGFYPGILLAMAAAFHMYHSLKRAFMCDAKTAARLVAGGYIVRYLAVAVFLAILLMTEAGYALAGFLGVMGLKAAAYLQPLTHKFYNYIFHEEDPIAQPLPETEEGEDGEK